MKRLIVCLTILVLVACGNNSPDNEAENATTPPASSGPTASAPVAPDLINQLLARIDPEPAMLWLSLEPLPQPLLEQLWAQMDQASEMNEDAYEEMAEDTDDPLVRALLMELGKLDSPEAWAERGINIAGLAGAHTVGIFPLLHWQISDPGAFEATVERIETEAETSFTRRQIVDQTVIWHDLGEVGLAIHHDASFMTLGLIADRPELLRRVANVDPAEPALQLAEVNAFNTARGLLNNSAGFIDFQRVLALLMDSEDPLLVSARAEGPLGAVASDEACRAELGALTRTFPRQSFGTTAADANSMEVLARLETDPGFGLRLGALADSPMSLDLERSGLLSVGMAINIIAARDFGRELVAGWIDNPPVCHLFSTVAEQAPDWQLALNRPIPPLVTNMHGMRLQLDQLDMQDGELASAVGNLALFMRNPQMMLGMAQMFSPELAALNLTPGGEPQPVPAALVPNLEGIPAWLGLSETALGLAIGESNGLSTALAAGQADSRIFAVGVDLAAYSNLVKLGLASLPTEQAEEFDSAETAQAMELLTSLYRYTHTEFRLAEPGVDVVIRVELAD
ncbi:MAG: hypothetical protein V2J42_11630 [Wenzhouxiangella sp.]|jgi:hypothetical protein|nr:hypothetical protein [Wenzhouxiangella sp.]